ncbi:hypothetical protein QTH91_14550 [Variovorax dokdonensis]|uniref:Peptidase S8/S53 domain-containing protein n=1 Tax=Variovorax dokdonensis TaxID=344883 RepID=A0ABT7NCM6_9BURK|nr:hypothetical protein [Variovorax dokdonensis]MDM0045707.1 hypothetical protein [Variovorax dokdonensis]
MNATVSSGHDFDGDLPLACDLYLQWAIETDYVDVPNARIDQDATTSVGLLIEWKTQQAASDAAELVHALVIHVPSVYLGGSRSAGVGKIRRVWALTVPTAKLPDFLRRAGRLATRIELAMPMAEGKLGAENVKARLSRSPVLAAVLDDGCAFANDRFRDGMGTRILWLWNQDPEARGAPLIAGRGPTPQANFGYGGQYSKGDLDDLFDTADGRQDQAYQGAGLAGMRRRATHGAHVMDLLTNTEAPWPSGADPWEIVFVQFPRGGVEDPSGIWLKRHALDGLNYALACAGSDTRTVVANISWGPQTGPHDGNSALEVGIEELVQAQADLDPPRKLIISLPAGNSYGTQSHARVDYADGGSFDWHVPPDGELPAFIELWWPKGVLPGAAALRITAPGKASVAIEPGKNAAPDKSWWARLKKIGDCVKVLVVVRPTYAPGPSGRMPGQHGRWHFEIAPTPSGIDGSVHAYVARANHNMGARRRAKASYLCDAALQASRFVAPASREEEALDSAIRRVGTLNGLATGASTYVAAGYVSGEFEIARYSSAGPTRGMALKPDFACLTDRSQARPGLRATGSRTGTTAVLVGTSTAAPQLGRMLVMGPPPVEYTPSPPRPERVGAGCLGAQPWLLRKE